MVATTLVDSGLGEGDAAVMADITGNGLPDIFFVQQDGVRYWYEHEPFGTFSRHQISPVSGFAKFEGIAVGDFDGDGRLELYTLDQHNGQIWVHIPDDPANPRGSWSGGVLRTDHRGLQNARVISWNGKPCLLFTHEGRNATSGGIYALTYNGSGDIKVAANWTRTLLVQHPGAWWMEDPLPLALGGDQIIPYTGRKNMNGSPLLGLFYVTLPQPGAPLGTLPRTAIHESQRDWCHYTTGDFFGNGVQTDFVIQDTALSIPFPNVTLKFFDSSNGWAETSLALPKSRAQWNVVNLRHQHNGRDVLLIFGGSEVGELRWSGTAWEFYKWDVATKKVDGPVPMFYHQDKLYVLLVDSGLFTISLVETDYSRQEWTPFLDGERVVKAFMQEDVSDGMVGWVSRGVKPVLSDVQKLPDDGGVKFSGKGKISWPSDNDAPWLHRWWAVIARLDGQPTTDVPVLTVNGGAGGAIHRQPYVKFIRVDNTLNSILDNSSIVSRQKAPRVDGWNILVGYRRDGMHHARINGQKLPALPFVGMLQNTDQSPSSIGTNTGPGETTLNVPMVVDCVLLGQGEPSEAWADKLEGWLHHRVGRLDLLPNSHPYKVEKPTFDVAADIPERFVFDQASWDAWAAILNVEKLVNSGNPPPAPTCYSLAFRDDFDTNTVVDDLRSAADGTWFAPTHVIGIGFDALATRVNFNPSCYVAGPSTLSLRMQETSPGSGQWVTGAFSSVNKEGHGRVWGGRGRFIIRCKFPALPAPRPDFYPAFWAYNAEHLFWRTRNRLELDFFEYNGVNGKYLNTTQHVHAPPIPSTIPGIRQAPDLEDKIFGAEIGFDIYDGAYHTWEFRVDTDYSYIIADDLERARVPTTPWLLAEKYVLVNWAMRKAQGAPVSGQIYDMTIDWIEIWNGV